jgi:hypothetical protein
MAWNRNFHADMMAAKDQAMIRRNRGEAVGRHESYDRLAMARRELAREAAKARDNFDEWLSRVAYRVEEIRCEYMPLEKLAALVEFGAIEWSLATIPF